MLDVIFLYWCLIVLDRLGKWWKLGVAAFYASWTIFLFWETLILEKRDPKAEQTGSTVHASNPVKIWNTFFIINQILWIIISHRPPSLLHICWQGYIKYFRTTEVVAVKWHILGRACSVFFSGQVLPAKVCHNWSNLFFCLASVKLPKNMVVDGMWANIWVRTVE